MKYLSLTSDKAKLGLSVLTIKYYVLFTGFVGQLVKYLGLTNDKAKFGWCVLTIRDSVLFTGFVAQLVKYLGLIKFNRHFIPLP